MKCFGILGEEHSTVNVREVQSHSQEYILRKTDYTKKGGACRAPAAFLPKGKEKKFKGKKDLGSQKKYRERTKKQKR